jgi:hypothetical protein
MNKPKRLNSQEKQSGPEPKHHVKTRVNTFAVYERIEAINSFKNRTEQGSYDQQGHHKVGT